MISDMACVFKKIKVLIYAIRILTNKIIAVTVKKSVSNISDFTRSRQILQMVLFDIEPHSSRQQNVSNSFVSYIFNFNIRLITTT